MQHLFSETPGHDSYPVESIAGTLGEMFMRKDDTVAIKRIFRQIVWQLENLETLQHPYAERVRTILEQHGYTLENPESLQNIVTLRNELFDLADFIRQEIRNIIGDTQKEESTPLRIYRHIDEEHPAAA